MRSYAETTDCRRRMLLGYLGEQVEDPCGYCDSCDAATSTVRKWTDKTGRTDQAGRTDGETMDHPEFGTGTVMSSEPDG